MKDRYPNLYAIEINKDCLIMDRVIFNRGLDAQWNWFWPRQPRRGREANQLSNLINRLLNFRFSGSPDRWVWRDDSRDGFAMKHVRSLLDINGDNKFCSFNWVKWIPIKINCFM